MGTSSLSLTQEIRVAASPATVFRCLTEPEQIVKWFGRRVDADARVGGHIRVEINDTATMSGEFVEIVKNTKVAFSFGWEQSEHNVPPGSTTVEFEMVADGETTLVRLNHYGLPSEQSTESHNQGWANYMPRLKKLSEGADPGLDPFGTQSDM